MVQKCLFLAISSGAAALWAALSNALLYNSQSMAFLRALSYSRFPFWPKMRSILRQNGARFAAKWSPFCGKMENGCVMLSLAKCYDLQKKEHIVC